jgi:hypothetical protein
VTDEVPQNAKTTDLYLWRTPLKPHMDFYAAVRTIVRHNIAGLSVPNAAGTPAGISSAALVWRVTDSL